MAGTPDISARALRDRFRSSESEATRLRLLEAAATSLAQETQLKSALASVLMQGMRFLAADSGLVLLLEGGGLTVQAAQGAVLPVGARIPLGGALGTVLRPPMQPSLREHIESRLRIGKSPEVALELLLPLCFGGKALGVLALMSEAGRVMPTEEDLQTLRTLATLIGCAAGNLGAARPRAPRREVADSLARLTAREQQVFALLPRGLSNAEIGEQLGIATGTAKIHIERILHKLGLKDRTQAAVRAAEWGHRA
ncbi:MAG TPA: LuxR C-terminal-related transcriptional regulator [Solimonas sp.]